MLGQAQGSAANASWRAWIGVGAPILGLVLVTIMLAVATFAGFAREQNRAFERSSSRLVASAVEGRSRALTSVTLDYANWDEAYDAISRSWNADWVENNIYSSVADGMILFRANGDTRYAWFSDDFEAETEVIQISVVEAAVSIPQLRQLARRPTTGETVTFTFAQNGGRLLVIAVAPISNEDDSTRVSRTPPYDYLAAVDIIDATEIQAIAGSLGLEDIAFSTNAGAAHDDRIGRLITAADGTPAGVISWRHARPGRAAFEQQIWPVILALLIVGGLALLIARALVARHIGAMANESAALEAGRAKSEFLARVSQELRTPLNAVIGYAEIIEEENEDERTREDAGRIIVAARHLGQLLNDILDQSRIDAGQIKLHLEVLPVAGMVAEVQGLLAPVAKSKQVVLSMEPSPYAPFVNADHMRLRQCLLKLIGNAIKFTPEHGSVRVSTHLEGQFVVFEIADTGIGIAPGELTNIFRRFGQANASIGREFGGAGLGLSITRDLARGMGGDVTVESEFGNGSTFRLFVPAATANALRAA